MSTSTGVNIIFKQIILILLYFFSLRVNCQISLVTDSLGAKVWECGKQGDIESIEGHSASPWTVEVFKIEGSQWKYTQSGTLIGLQTVLTCGSPALTSVSSYDTLAIRAGTNQTGLESLLGVGNIEPLESVSTAYSVEWARFGQNGDLYLLHLKNPIHITTESRPLCLDTTYNIFENKKSQSAPRNIPNSQNVYLSGFVNPEGIHSKRSVQLSPSKRWRIKDWDEDAISLLDTTLKGFGHLSNQKRENQHLPGAFDAGSALVYKKGDRWFLLGVKLMSRNNSSAPIRSIEKLTPSIYIKQQCVSHQACSGSEGYCLPAFCDRAFFCQCSTYFNYHCGSVNLNDTIDSCGQAGSFSEDRNQNSEQRQQSQSQRQSIILPQRQPSLPNTESHSITNQRTHIRPTSPQSTTTPISRQIYKDPTTLQSERNPITQQSQGIARPNTVESQRQPILQHQSGQGPITTRPSYSDSISRSSPIYSELIPKPFFCPPVTLGESSKTIDLSCRFANGSRAGLICSQQPVEIGSTVVLTCTNLDTTLRKTCNAQGIWEPPYHLDCPIKYPFAIGHQYNQDQLLHFSQMPQPVSTKRPYYDTQGQGPSQQQSQYYEREIPRVENDDVGKCPAMELHEGLKISCSGPLNGTGLDCASAALPGTIVMIQCKPFYVSTSPDTQLEKKCDSSGNWLPRKPFACSIDCGTTDISKLPFVVHGSKTQSALWPWHAALFFRVNGTYQYLCGGTLISRSIITTAAHCVEKASKGRDYLPYYKVAIGAISSNFSVNLKDDQTQIFDISNVSINPHYNNRSYEGDFAIIRLSRSVTLTEFVRPVCFPYPNDKNTQLERYQLSEGSTGYVVGFGTDESWNISLTLKTAKLPYVSVKECTKVLDRQPTISQYCAGYTNGTSVCEGDSGGGMFFQDESTPRRFFIQGIISHGNRDAIHARCDNKKYSVFTRVGAFNDWAKSIVDSLEYDYQ